MSMKSFLIGALLVALIALGYIYWKDQNTISINTSDLEIPGISVETQ